MGIAHRRGVAQTLRAYRSTVEQHCDPAREKAMALIDFRTPAAGFDQPLELWLACHDRVRRMTGLLERLHEHMQEKGADDAAQVTATSIRRYFDEAAPRHHEDEEIDLFPLLRRLLPQKDPARLPEVEAALSRLEAEHVSLGRVWQLVRPVLEAIERGEPATLDAEVVRAFAAGYRGHCEVEDTVVADALKLCLGDADLDALGQAMAERRGVDWSHLHSSRNGGK
jgi:hypothetical protein